MLKRAGLFLLIVAAFSLSSLVAFAQQGGGSGNGGPDDAPGQGPCDEEPQGRAYRSGGTGFVDAENGNRWDDRQRDVLGNGNGRSDIGFYATLPPAYEGELPEEVINLMIEGWLDEQHAFAVYEAVMRQFGEINPFANIQQAEAQHSAAWEFLFDRYGVETPAVPEYEFAEFASVAEACTLAAQAEVANFELYDTMLEVFAEYPDLYQVALALRNASEFNHLPAFEGCAGS